MTDVLKIWFPNDKFNKFWFDKSKDSKIKMEYGTILNFVEKEVIDVDSLSDLEILEKIIILDQFSRSIYREEKEKVKFNDKKALNLSLNFLAKRNWINIKLNHLIFYLMPLRHTFDKEYYEKIFEILQIYNLKDNDKELYNKFIKITKRIYDSLNI